MTNLVSVDGADRVRLDLVAALTCAHRGMVADTGELAAMLYAEWYAAARGRIELSDDFPLDLVAVLRSAHAGSDQWETGWLAHQVSPRGQVIARRGNDLRLLERCDYVVVGRLGLLARPGDQLIVSGRRDVVDPDRGWWRTAGAGWSFARPPGDLVRVYWNTAFPDLPELVRRLTGILARATAPWMLKCATQVAAHERADATLLFLTRAGVTALATPLRAVALAMADRTRTAAPPLTFPVAPGLSAAYDPGGGESFGEHRCRLIAEAVAGHGEDERPKAVDAVVARFAADDIGIDRPFARRTDPELPWEP